ncbi:hypothetical protein Pmani_020996 [Petrolisthes manimaculis]|uniref:Uncharacterized protein n=1 Tax=Petrolisthes manimaculis TaxID=1843537 RepID=A0AAE1PF31_9EUCA|nr:hypothetical protein Pmani_020996 [Petrolisthes manimaculis]
MALSSPLLPPLLSPISPNLPKSPPLLSSLPSIHLHTHPPNQTTTTTTQIKTTTTNPTTQIKTTTTGTTHPSPLL